MRVSMTIESDGVFTEVSREYEPEVVSDELHYALETPGLDTVVARVAEAAVIVHRFTNI